MDADLKEQGHCKGWMMGGGTLASSFLQAGLITELQLFTMPMFLVTVFCGGVDLDQGVLPGLLGILKYVGLVVVIVLIRNTAPRVRVDQAVKFFWGPVSWVAVLAVVLAYLGY